MTIESHLIRWWEQRSDDQHQALTTAAQEDRMDGDTVRLLIETRCPIGPIGTKWESDPEYGWTWPESVRTFVTAQSE